MGLPFKRVRRRRPVLLYGSDFSAGVDGWEVSENLVLAGNVDGVGGLNDTLRGYANATSGQHSFYKTMSVVAEKRYRVRFRYFLPAGQTNTDHLTFLNYDTATYVPWETVNLLVTDRWVDVEYSFVAARTAMALFIFYLKNEAGSAYVGANSASDDRMYLRDFTIEQV